MNPEQIAGIRSSLEFGDKFVAIFAGSHHFPNFRAVEIVLGLARELPDAIFLIMGTVCRYGKLRGILPKNVVCLGAVSESAKWVAFQAADAGLNPMEQGSGTNIKMFEYAAAGLAVVSTPFGARGVGLAPGSEFVETESPGFADAILALMMEDRREVRAMGLRARKRIAEIADWSVIGARYRENFHALLA